MNTTQPQRPDTAQHTPTNWRIGDAGLTVFGPRNGKPAPEIVATCRSKANARFIAKACNNHENLIGQLYECAELLEQAKLYADKSGDCGMAAFYASGAEQARAALASAQS